MDGPFSLYCVVTAKFLPGNQNKSLTQSELGNPCYVLSASIFLLLALTTLYAN